MARLRGARKRGFASTMARFCTTAEDEGFRGGKPFTRQQSVTQVLGYWKERIGLEVQFRELGEHEVAEVGSSLKNGP